MWAKALRAPSARARAKIRFVVHTTAYAPPQAYPHGRRLRPKRRKPHRGYRDEASIKGGGDLLSHNKCSTIGAKGLNFSVRYGKRWIPLAITALSLNTSRIREASLWRVCRPRSQTRTSDEERVAVIASKLKEAIGRLVPLGYAHRCASTCGLSTWSSPTALSLVRARSVHLGAGFALRCLQRLSVPHIATRRCSWRHNRYTSGASDSVLSY